jgi:hypothetical protein
MMVVDVVSYISTTTFKLSSQFRSRLKRTIKKVNVDHDLLIALSTHDKNNNQKGKHKYTNVDVDLLPEACQYMNYFSLFRMHILPLIVFIKRVVVAATTYSSYNTTCVGISNCFLYGEI